MTAELLQLGFGPDERVTIIIEAVEGVATTRQKSQVCLVVAGRADGDSALRRERQSTPSSLTHKPVLQIFYDPVFKRAP